MGENLILRFYDFFNGQPVSIEQLIAYRQKVENYVDSIGSGEYVPKLSAIKQTVTKAIKDLQAKGITDIEKMELVNDPKPVVPKQPTPPKLEVVVKEVVKVMKQPSVAPELKEIKKQLGGLKKVSDQQNKAVMAKLQKEKKLFIKNSKGKRTKKETLRVAKKVYEKVLNETSTAKEYLKKAKPLQEKIEKGINPLKGVEPTTTNDQPPTKEKPKTLSGIDYTYTPIELGPYKPDFERLFSDTVVGIFGLPGHGKTTYLLKLAQYLATQGKKVLFVAREEYGRSEFDIKLKEHNIGHPNLTFNKQLEANELKAADVVFLDSVNALKLDASGVEKIYHQYPNKLWFLILQSIKSGNFRGSQEWEHVVSVFGEIQNRKLILRKNRLDPNNSAKAAELQKTNAITEAKKKAEVKEAVKTAMAKPTPSLPTTDHRPPENIKAIAA